MLSRIASVALTGGSIVGGVVIERLAEQSKAKAPSLPPPDTPDTPAPQKAPLNLRSGTGNDRLRLMSDAVHGERSPTPVADGVAGKVTQIGNVLRNGVHLAANAKMLSDEEIEHLADTFMNDVQMTAGAAKLTSGTATLNDADKSALGGAVLTDAWDKVDVFKPVESAKKVIEASKVLATTEVKEVDAFLASVRSRVVAEAEVAVAGGVTVSAVAAVLSKAPHPVLKGAGATLQLVNAAAFGNHASSGMRALRGAADPEASATSKEVARILAEKGS